METENFVRTLRGLTRRVPFQSFRVELINGIRFEIEHPEALILHGGTAIYLAPDYEMTIFDASGVVRFSTMAESTPRAD